MTKPIPKGWHSVTPRLVAHDPRMLVDFLKHAFRAAGDFRTDSRSVIRIGDSLVMVSSVGPSNAMPAFLYLYVDDIDATYRRALEAGAVSLEEPWGHTLWRPSRDGPGSVRQHLANRNSQRVTPLTPEQLMTREWGQRFALTTCENGA